MRSSWLSASVAPRRFCSRMTSSRALRERTSAYSAITKNALTATSRAARISFSPVTPDRGEQPAEPPPGSAIGRCYFGEVRLRRSSAADALTVAGGAVAGGASSTQPVDPQGEREVGVGEASLRVSRELEAHLVPTVDEDVGVMVGGLREVGDAVDEGDRGGKVGVGPLAHDRVSLARPAAAR